MCVCTRACEQSETHPFLLHTCNILSDTTGAWSSPSCVAASPSWKQYVSDHSGSKCFRQKKEETKEPPLLVSLICSISDPSHVIRPGEGSLHTVLPTLCSHYLHASATLSSTRSVKKSLTGFLICATWDPATSSCSSSHKQESF